MQRHFPSLFVLLTACATHGVGDHVVRDGGTGGDLGGDLGAPPSDGSVDGGSHSPCPPPTGATIVGTTYAPNGMDPIPNVFVYATPDTQTFPGPATMVSCEQCTTSAPGAIATTQSRDDGTFTLGSDTLDAGGTFTIVVQSGGFRHVERHVVLGMCGNVMLGAAQTKLPGANAGDDTIPRIAIASSTTGTGDVNDKFALVLDALGITGYDRIEPDKTGTPTAGDMIALLSDATMLDQYQILIAPCGTLGNFGVAAHLTATMVSNLQSWLAMGGRLYASDLAYSIAQQPFPSAINFATGPSPHAGADPADVGQGITAGTTLNADVDDLKLRAWLQLVGALSAGATQIPVSDLRDPWGAIDTMPAPELLPDPMGLTHADVYVSGDVMWHTAGSGHHPLTVEADYPGTGGASYCGRVVFTSYHVQSATATTLTPQERVLEYLFFQLSSCIETLH